MYGTMITKQIKCQLSKGILELQMSNELIDFLFNSALFRFCNSMCQDNITTYKPDKLNILIGDKNGKVQADINCLGLKYSVWCIIDDYGDYFVSTLLLPNER